MFTRSVAVLLLLAACIIGCGRTEQRRGLAHVVVPAAAQVAQIQNIDGSSGSAVAVDARGYLVTCEHVIRGQTTALVSITSEIKVVGVVLAVDAENDLALIQVDRRLTDVAELGDSDTLRMGDTVFAVGFPYAIGKLAELGIFSGYRRDGGLLTDTAINPGHSGGGLFDGHGRLVGINESYHSPGLAGGNTGIANCVPSKIVRVFLDQHLPAE